MIQVFVALSVHISVRPLASPSFSPSVVLFVAANSSSRIRYAGNVPFSFLSFLSKEGNGKGNYTSTMLLGKNLDEKSL